MASFKAFLAPTRQIEEDIMRNHTISLAILGLGLAFSPVLAQQAAQPLNGGDRVSAQADGIGAREVGPLLRQAAEAARGGRLPLALELVERAETLVLTRGTIAGTETIPLRAGPVAVMQDARAALSRRDVAAATTAMAEAERLTAGM
jgi:hypothetical protein